MSGRHLACLLTFVVSTTAPAQESPYREVIAKAETMIDRGDDAGAIVLLNSYKCVPEQARCAPSINFALGYAFDALSGSQHDDTLETKAIAAYEQVLAIYPNDPNALVNIAVIQKRLNQTKAAAASFERAAAADPQRRGTHLLAAAEVWRDAGAFDDARIGYVKAGEAGATQAWSRLASLCSAAIAREENAGRRAEAIKLTYLLALELKTQGRAAVALDLLEPVIRYGYEASPQLAEEALVAWVELHAFDGTLSSATLSRLPSTSVWPSPLLAQLTASMSKGEWHFGEPWLLGARRYIAAAAANAVADVLVAQGQHDRAIRLYERVLQETDTIMLPPLSEADQARREAMPDPYMAAAVQLERLYHLANNADAVSLLEGRLFADKGDAYHSHDLAAIQRLHTVLGTIYADRDVWDSNEPSENATFQFRNAVRTARERTAATGILQPLPYMSEMVAHGLEIQRQWDDAQEWYVDATRDYLEVDAIDKARETLAHAAAETKARPNPRLAVSIDALNKITDFRAGIQQLGTTRGVTPPLITVAADDSVLDKAFVERQEFKTLTDLAGRASELREAKEASSLYLRAFDKASSQKTVGGTGDALRLEQIRNFGEKEWTIKGKPLTDKSAVDKVWTVPTSGHHATKVTWPTSFVEKATVLSQEQNAKPVTKIDATAAQAAVPPP
jgi:tetratricopeptide (TPR) repeat protein